MLSHYDQARSAAQTQLVRDLMKTLNGEYHAITCYEKLAALAPTEEVKRKISEIRQDEIRHFQHFSHLYTRLTGCLPAPKLTEACATEYRAGVLASFTDEQNTVEYYLKVSDQVRDNYVKDLFRRTAADEQNHAVWFLSFLH
ncbi:ferritin-like domain-containing protein [Paenibacillus antarcticus]|uniref:Rubrerythrin family protein n=1 Tax=Paenibacillus antarcticus TaxID=253703 RepID=A0A168QBV0_9BACL|nr:ferritin-like domain-containing protein [Paenibacillus antarcticus]OAB47610.1 rubrerythrin family protein [Paenibacillus antarcticus]